MPVQIPLEVSRVDNRLTVAGDLGLSSYLRLLAAIHQATDTQGYADLILDFSPCTAAFSASMLAVCSQIMLLRTRGIDVSISLPVKDQLRKLFHNCNWANLLDPSTYDPSNYRGYSHVPATRFTSPLEQNSAVNAIINAVMGSLSGMDRHDIAAIEWSLAEITDNVLNHARCETGGLVQATTFEKSRRRVEFVVCDGGATIPGTLRETHREITSDPQALEKAIREGVTRDKNFGQGNGLFGSLEVCRISGGQFHVHSRNANLSYYPKFGLHIRRETIPFSGTLVVANIDCSTPGVLQKALKFGGEEHVPVDYIETHYELSGGEFPRFVMRNEASSFGRRLAGEPIKNKLLNLVSMVVGKRLVIDFEDVALISSSFADEAFGKLFVELGALRFGQSFEFVNVSEMVRSLIDKAITQRMTAARYV